MFKVTLFNKSVEVALIDNWKNAWRFLTVQFMAFVAIAPDIYNFLVAQNWIDIDPAPGSLSATLKIVATICIFLRMVKQNIPAPTPSPVPEGK